MANILHSRVTIKKTEWDVINLYVPTHTNPDLRRQTEDKACSLIAAIMSTPKRNIIVAGDLNRSPDILNVLRSCGLSSPFNLKATQYKVPTLDGIFTNASPVKSFIGNMETRDH
jgi:hypothetical protein